MNPATSFDGTTPENSACDSDDTNLLCKYTISCSVGLYAMRITVETL